MAGRPENVINHPVHRGVGLDLPSFNSLLPHVCSQPVNAHLSLGDGRGILHIRWQYCPDGDEEARKGAEVSFFPVQCVQVELAVPVPTCCCCLRWLLHVRQIIAMMNLPKNSALRSLPAATRRRLAQAQRIGLGSDISKHLPVLEPVFRYVMNHSGGEPEEDSVANRDSGISQEEFVGLLSQVCSCIQGGTSAALWSHLVRLSLVPRLQLTHMNEETLRVLFLKMDANGDGTLTWDEYISFLLKHADNALAHRRAQGCYLVSPPDRGSTTTTRIPSGLVSFHVLPQVEGYLTVARDHSVHVYDSEFRRSLVLDTASGPPPGNHVLPFTSEPTRLGPIHPGMTAHNVIARQNLSKYQSTVARHRSKTAAVRCYTHYNQVADCAAHQVVCLHVPQVASRGHAAFGLARAEC